MDPDQRTLLEPGHEGELKRKLTLSLDVPPMVPPKDYPTPNHSRSGSVSSKSHAGATAPSQAVGGTPNPSRRIGTSPTITGTMTSWRPDLNAKAKLKPKHSPPVGLPSKPSRPLVSAATRNRSVDSPPPAPKLSSRPLVDTAVRGGKEEMTLPPMKKLGAKLGMTPLRGVQIAAPARALAKSINVKRSNTTTTRTPRPQTADRQSEDAAARPGTSSTTKRFSYSTTFTGKSIKYGRGRHANTELSPQPSDDDDDPLNWPTWKKDLNLVSLLTTISLINAMKTAFVASGAVAASQLGATQVEMAALTGVPLMLSSLTGFASVTASKVWGKRPAYLISMLLLFIGSMWNMRANTSFGECMGARVFQGLGWGAFDALIIGSIQDSYFEHQRRPRVALYDIVSVGTTWGPPLLSGVAARDSGGFTRHFEIINLFYLASAPLLAFAAPETAYDRWFSGSVSASRAATLNGDVEQQQQHRQTEEQGRTAPGTGLGMTLGIGKLRLRLPTTDEAKAYLGTMKPLSGFRGLKDSRTLLQGVRAAVAPTTGLAVLATFLPHGALWGLTHALAPLFGTELLGPADVASLLAAPFTVAVSTVGAFVFVFWRRPESDLSKITLVMVLSGGTVSAFAGMMALGLGTRDTQEGGGDDDHSYGLISVQLGVLSAGVYMLQATVRPVIWRSAEFTGSTLHVCLRNAADMEAAAGCWRSFFAGVFVLGFASAIERTSTGGEGGVAGTRGLGAAVIGLGTSHLWVAVLVCVAWWFMDETIRMWDGRVIGSLIWR